MRWVRSFIKPSATAEPTAAPWSGERVDVDLYWAQAWADLMARQGAMVDRLKLTDATWRVDQDAALIEFDRRDGALVRGPVQIIGSWNPKNETFSWAWDHPSVHTRCRADAERTRWFGDAHALDELTRPQVRASESEAWRLTAIAMKVNAAHGAYRGPTDGPFVFMTVGDFKVLGEPTAA